MYSIVFSEDAKKDLKSLQKKAPQALIKLAKLLDELKEHPRTGTGQGSPRSIGLYTRYTMM
jgi:toxin YoeB